ncbi:hypothetical protein CYLTODRAFT_458873 [Cylindrobasidium torrendii FP15055 ss-10]|uniref:Family A G protein-coupled receptor-like protein n=1 Tax=Cylindrobasidium torrendii FP15055 ss-10 TaxID=1314674 RepID=A0A0D7AX61_9AGAR|nr:hypothetical protein CYLTODRAFT_458873 [Cylindrobasidium torrendii FP15055 ss-10]
MTSEEQRADVWMIFISSQISTLISATLLWTCTSIAFAFALRVQLKREVQTRASRALITTTCLFFLFTTAAWVMRLGVVYSYLHRDVDNAQIYLLVEGVMVSVNYFLGDAVLLWRAWALTQQDWYRWLIAIPFVFLCVGLVFTGFIIACVAPGAASAFTPGSALCTYSPKIVWAVSFLTNVWATAMIAAKAWELRRFMKYALGRPGSTKGEKVLAVLVESGAFYMLFWLVTIPGLFVTLSTADSYISQTGSVHFILIISSVGCQLSGLIPMVIIILVHRQCATPYDLEVESLPVVEAGRCRL